MPARSGPDGRPVLSFHTPAAFEAWLKENVDAGAIWLKLAKRASGAHSVSYEEAVECALCYGWIDGQKQALDDRFWLQRFSVRRPRSPWSKINRERAERLLGAGRVAAPGLAEIDKAREDGRWDSAYAGAREATLPPELSEAFEADARLSDAFRELSASERYSIIWRINQAKRAETRARRVAAALEKLADSR
jgi:uncharacterized protein YdeI (YjbR/CyaY-like superfamily)